MFIGALKISGTDFDFGTIVEGAEIICNYTLDDAGSIKLEVEIPAVGEEFYGNFYARDDAQVDFNKEAHKINCDGEKLLDRVRDIGRAVKGDDYEKIQQAGDLASEAISADNSTHDAEELKHLEEQLAAARKTLADIRERNKFAIRRNDLDAWRDYYKRDLKNFAEPSEAEQMENLFTRAESLIERDDTAFDDALNETQHESILREFMNRQGYKPDELKLLNFMAASIYLQVGAAMTWMPYPDLAFELFRKALPYAEASGDAELISLARKRVDEFRELANRNSSNWLWWTIGAIVVLYLLS